MTLNSLDSLTIWIQTISKPKLKLRDYASMQDYKVRSYSRPCYLTGCSDCLPNDETNLTIKSNLHELLPKMIRMIPALPKTLQMLIDTFIDKFVATGEDVSFL